MLPQDPPPEIIVPDEPRYDLWFVGALSAASWAFIIDTGLSFAGYPSLFMNGPRLGLPYTGPEYTWNWWARGWLYTYLVVIPLGVVVPAVLWLRWVAISLASRYREKARKKWSEQDLIRRIEAERKQQDEWAQQRNHWLVDMARRMIAQEAAQARYRAAMQAHWAAERDEKNRMFELRSKVDLAWANYAAEADFDGTMDRQQLVRGFRQVLGKWPDPDLGLLRRYRDPIMVEIVGDGRFLPSEPPELVTPVYTPPEPPLPPLTSDEETTVRKAAYRLKQ